LHQQELSMDMEKMLKKMLKENNRYYS